MADSPPTIDGYRFVDGASRTVMRAWTRREPSPHPIPWTLLAKPLSEARVALISSAGVALRDDPPFDQEGERANPWWGDPSYRVVPRTASTADVRLYHLHIDPRPAAKDLDCVLPLRRLAELVERGAVGSSADEHYSVMGFLLDTAELVEETAPKIVAGLARDGVDLALLVPV